MYYNSLISCMSARAAIPSLKRFYRGHRDRGRHLSR